MIQIATGTQTNPYIVHEPRCRSEATPMICARVRGPRRDGYAG